MYRYVGPNDIRAQALRQPSATPIRSRHEVVEYVGLLDAANTPLTFVVSLDGDLLLAPRESEHVAAAAGDAVLSAGEMTFDASGRLAAATNQSTGYCPEPTSWQHVAEALDRIGVDHGDAFTTAFEFRRCPACYSINLVKEGFFICAVCGHDLPDRWNLAA